MWTQLQKFYTDFDELTWLLWFGFKLKPIVDSAPAISKNEAQFKSGEK